LGLVNYLLYLSARSIACKLLTILAGGLYTPIEFTTERRIPAPGPRFFRLNCWNDADAAVAEALPEDTFMEQETRELLTVEQAADYLQVSQSSIRSYIRQGMLKAFRIAGKRKVLIPRTELLSLLEPARNDSAGDSDS
jgi:excisionase family DNA binding protein